MREISYREIIKKELLQGCMSFLEVFIVSVQLLIMLSRNEIFSISAVLFYFVTQLYCVSMPISQSQVLEG